VAVVEFDLLAPGLLWSVEPCVLVVAPFVPLAVGLGFYEEVLQL